jgi:serine/threonine protein kinase
VLHIPSIQERALNKEVDAIKKLCGPGTHVNIVQVLKHGLMSNPALYFIDMELCHLTLHDFIHQKASLGDSSPDCFTRGSVTQIWDVMSQIASGVQYVHREGQVHRDIKPKNGNLCSVYD